MNTRKAWIVYIALRLLFFAVPFAGLMLLLRDWPYWTAAILSTLLAALIAVSLSLILLSKPRETASESIYDWRNRQRTADDIVEDEAIEAFIETSSDEDRPNSGAPTSPAG